MVVVLIFLYYGVLDLDDCSFESTLLSFLGLPVGLVTYLRGSIHLLFTMT